MPARAGLPKYASFYDALQPIFESGHFLPVQQLLQLAFCLAAIAAELVLKFYQISQ